MALLLLTNIEKAMKNSIFKYSFLAFLLFAAFAIDTGCKKENDDMSPTETPAPAANTANVGMQNNVFSPPTITVAVNTTVTWKNNDAMAHTVTSNSGAFDSGTINAGGTYSYKFTATGTFEYHCTLHSGMTGTVIVQ
jgi:plastocyanin